MFSAETETWKRIKHVMYFQGSLKRIQKMFSVHITPEKFENTTITGHFRFVF